MQPLVRTAGFSLLLLAASCGVGAQPEPQNSRLTAIKMDGELPARAAIAGLFAELDFQQATQSYLWALPLVSYAQWQAEFRDKLHAGNGDLMVLESYEDKLGVITANATTPYILGFVDLNQTGPMVVELPPAPPLAGSATSGNGRSPTWARPARTRARAASTWCCRRAIRNRPTPTSTTWPNRKP